MHVAEHNLLNESQLNIHKLELCSPLHVWACLMVFSHQSKTTTRQRQYKWWTCAFLWCLSHQVRHVWCENYHRNVQVQHLSCCLVLLSCRCLVVLLWCENTIRKSLGMAACRWQCSILHLIVFHTFKKPLPGPDIVNRYFCFLLINTEWEVNYIFM